MHVLNISLSPNISSATDFYKLLNVTLLIWFNWPGAAVCILRSKINFLPKTILHGILVCCLKTGECCTKHISYYQGCQTMPISKTCAYFQKQCIRKLYCAYFHRKCLFFIYGVTEVSLHFHSQKFLSEKLNQPTNWKWNHCQWDAASTLRKCFHWHIWTLYYYDLFEELKMLIQLANCLLWYHFVCDYFLWIIHFDRSCYIYVQWLHCDITKPHSDVICCVHYY